MTQSTKCSTFELFIYTVWACLKGITQQKTLQEKLRNKNDCNDNYDCYSDTILLSTEIYKTFETFIYLRTVNNFTVTLAQKEEMHPMQAEMMTNNMARSEYCSACVPNSLMPPNIEELEDCVEFNSFKRC